MGITQSAEEIFGTFRRGLKFSVIGGKFVKLEAVVTQWLCFVIFLYKKFESYELEP
jgi:hypothetical protein